MKTWATETVLSPWLAADEARVSHVLSHVVWWKLELPKLCYHPGWRLMRLGYRMCFHTLYDENLSYRNCVITLVGGWWGQGIARVLTHCMMKTWATETVLSPWLAADEARVSHVLSYVVWWKLELLKLCYHPGWRLMRLGYRTCFHTLYDEKKNF